MKTSHRFVRLLLAFVVCASLVNGLWVATPAAAAGQPQDGALRIEAIYGPNLIVDSNVESPSTYAPRSGTFAARVCNTGTTALTDVFVSVGDYDPNGDTNPSDSTAGIYPSRTLSTPIVGTFSLRHEGGSSGRADATRFFFSLAPGACTIQYWLFSYPRLDANGNSVTAGIKPDDDLTLNFDMWARATDGASTRQVNITETVTMRNEISASANKIWPNGDNKVPDQYVQAIADTFGWGTFAPGGGSTAYPGELVRTQGVWYDLGNVGAGFDNDGDFVPDHNAWLQPIGDPNAYDPGCFRLVRTFGILVVKLVGGGEKLIPFVDNLYFQNIPDNTGVVGLVYYEYAALDGACTAALSPYQEVASGFDNEKFNADFGVAIPPLQSRESTITMDKTVDKATVGPALPDTLNYAISFTNPGPVKVGAFAYGAPLVISDTLPLGTVYVAGSATANNILPAGVSSYRVLYSTNYGQTWTTTEPAASTVTTIQWWLAGDMPVSTSGTVRYQATVPATYLSTRPPVVPNTGALSFGNNDPFLEDTASTVVLGNNMLSGTVFRDIGTGGLFANGLKDSAEAGIANVTLSLYMDTNNDGKGDVLVGTAVSNGSGGYSFANLPDGNFVVVIDTADPDLPVGYTTTTPTKVTAALDASHTSVAGVTQDRIDFGFAPALTVAKTLLPAAAAIYESDTVTYTIDLVNTLPGTGSPVPVACSRIAWAEVADTTTSGGGNGFFLNRSNVAGVGGPNQTYASSAFANNTDEVRADTFAMAQPGAITKVEALFSVYGSGTFIDDYAGAEVLLGATSLGSNNFTAAQLNALVGQANQGLLTWDVTTLRPWTFSDFSGNTLDLKFFAKKVGSLDGRTLYIDAMGFRVTTNQICAPTPATTINPLPLTDTYDPSKLQFVSASPPVDSSAPVGTLTWNNLGPLYPGGTVQVMVTFKALQPTTSPVNASNTATVNAARFANGTPANTGIATATVPLIATGSISGVVWSDVGTLGWVGGVGGTGYQAGTDRFVPNATVALWACTVNGVVMTTPTDATRSCTNNTNGGTWTLIATTTTDANGIYRFDGLRDGFYRTVVNTASLPGTVTQTGDPNVRTGPCSANCDNQSNTPTDALSATFTGRILNANDVTTVNYGYVVNPALYGRIWEDIDGNGSQSSLEPRLSGTSVTVSLYANATCTGTPVATVATTDGTYRFPNLTAGTTYCVGTTTPVGFSRTGETDGTVNNQITRTLTAGEISGSHDFGFRQTGSATIGDTLYYDWNGDGSQQSASEAGIVNVTMRLYRDMNGNGTFNPAIDALVDTTTTTSNGQYLFSAVPSGNYLVVVDSADPDLPSFVYQTGDPNEVGICAICDNQSPVSGVNGTSAYLTHDFGYKPSGGGAIGDTVWFDRNADGIQSGTQEIGLANVTVNLTVDLNGDGISEVIATTTTDANGTYRFSDLPPGNYGVTVLTSDPDLPKDAFGNAAAPTTATSRTIALPANATNLTADFGFAPLGAIGDTIYWDANGNGTQDWNETGISGVPVSLCRDLNSDGDCADAGETSVGTTTTTVGGTYLFTGLTILPAGGTYLVSVGAIPGNPILTADPNADGVPCTVAGAVGCDGRLNVTMLPGANFMGADFGYQPSVVIGDTLWVDTDGDGVKDGTEAGIANVTITLCTVSGSCVTTQTDADGNYFFQNVADGTYTVAVDTTDVDFPAGLTASFDADGAANGSTTVVVSGGAVTTVGVPCTNCGLNADFGYRYAGALSLSGTICRDGTEANRICGSGPTGVVTTTGEVAATNTTVFLLKWTDTDNDGVIDGGETVSVGSTITTAGGDYSFPNLPGGNYIVALAAPDDNLVMVTRQGDTPADRVVVTPGSGATSSAYQVVSLTSNVQGVDFAFQATVASDFGDLPTSYSTDLSGTPIGPSHQINATPTLYLGTIAPDPELNGTPSSTATADGTDEDGVTFPTTWVEGPAGGSVTVSVQGTGWLVGWVDLDKNGKFDQANEMVISQAVSTGTQTYTFDIPTNMIAVGSRNVYSRFRLFSTKPLIPALAYTGAAVGGEVEDYLLVLATPTNVSMVSFTAQARSSDIRLRWQTGAEVQTAGFNIYRSTNGLRDQAVRLNNSLIAAQGTDLAYIWDDATAAADVTYTYWVEEVRTNGTTQEFGPVVARLGQTLVWQVFLPILVR